MFWRGNFLLITVKFLLVWGGYFLLFSIPVSGIIEIFKIEVSDGVAAILYLTFSIIALFATVRTLLKNRAE
jgi:hypothetical protein